METTIEKKPGSTVPELYATRPLPTHLICFSHLRWDFVYQRPQHILTRLSQTMKVIFLEEPIYDAEEPAYVVQAKSDDLLVVTPHLQPGLSPEQATEEQKKLFDGWMQGKDASSYVFWYYTPMALGFSRHYQPKALVYDCMDELSAFKFAPPELQALETELFDRASVVFTGGHSLYQAKKHRHRNIHLFPSSIDKAHFARARNIIEMPADQKSIAGPIFGFFGVIDERFDIELITTVASARPEWQFVLLGPVVKIDPETLPRFDNIHYLGPKAYEDLPGYLAGWDIAMIPFAMNESTRYISPTKTPEYLAAGIPVISTPIRDVVTPYHDRRLVHIAGTAGEFISAAETILQDGASRQHWLDAVDRFLEGNSWDNTVSEMTQHIRQSIETNN